MMRVQLGAAHEDERACASGGHVQRVRHRLLAGPGRTDEQQWLGDGRLPSDGLSQRAHGSALAEQWTLDTAARLAQELLGDAQLALAAPPFVRRRAPRARHWPPAAPRRCARRSS